MKSKKKILVIGANSKIIRSISSKLSDDYVLISHKDIDKVDLHSFKFIYLFSWSHNSQNQNRAIINAMPIDKLIFISSMSVLTTKIRNQWADYPNNKAEIEEIVRSGGGTILRIGFYKEDNKKRFSFGAAYPVTSPDLLYEWINNFEPNKTENVFNLFEILSYPKTSLDRLFFSPLHNLSMKTDSIILRKILWLFSRVFGKENRGYSGDLLSCFSDKLQIGYGVLGSAFAKKYNSKDNNLKILISHLDDEIWNRKGFRLTRVGKKNTGLSKFWHGVSIEEKSDSLHKNVPLFVRRANLPKDKVIGNAQSFNYLDKHFCIKYIDEKNNPSVLYSNKLYLACGPFENIRLISDFLNTDSILSDQEVGRIGRISFADFYTILSPKIYGPFMYSRKVINRVLEAEGEKDLVRYLVEPRPSIGKYADFQLDFYMDHTRSIFFKLVKQFSLKRLNEALFNKFGFCVITKNIDLYIQILSKDCISYSKNNGFSRKRIGKETIEKINEDLYSIFNSFRMNENIDLVDALHAQGGSNLLDNRKLNNLMSKKKIIIIGSPTKYNLDALHHTKKLIGKL